MFNGAHDKQSTVADALLCGAAVAVARRIYIEINARVCVCTTNAHPKRVLPASRTGQLSVSSISHR